MKKSIKQNKTVNAGKTSVTVVPNYGSFVPLSLVLSLLLIGALAAATYARNSIYRTHVTLWAEVVKMAPHKRRAHENYGQALSSEGFYKEAYDQFKTVMALPDDGSVPLRDLYREIGVVDFRMGKFDDAIVAWQTGLRYAPNDPSLLNNLSIVYLQVGRFDEAAAAAQTALVGDPTMPQALNTMGQVYLMKKNYNKAVQYFLKAADREPDVPARYWNAALALEQAKQPAKAYEYASKYVEKETDPVARQRGYGYLEHLKQVLHR
ncbi:MAG: tetratricopeptide repeat protein [Nitrospiraceae bacterium]|nr:tetratricopeptide repeat protein [Nitrospiraceae bacterium]